MYYDDDTGAPAASILETNLLINSVISVSKQGAQFMSCDLKDFFFATPMNTPEYMKIHMTYFPQDIIDQYYLNGKVTSDGYIYMCIKKGMYGLKQAAVISYDNIACNLNPHGYHPIPHTLGLWKHNTRKTTFCLCVDDFCIKYYNNDDADHLLNSLKTNYKPTTDWSGTNFCGLILDCNYHRGYVEISMPTYIHKLLAKLQHLTPRKPKFRPFHVSPFTPKQLGQ